MTYREPSGAAVIAAAAVVRDTSDMRKSWRLQTTREMLKKAYEIDMRRENMTTKKTNVDAAFDPGVLAVDSPLGGQTAAEVIVVGSTVRMNGAVQDHEPFMTVQKVEGPHRITCRWFDANLVLLSDTFAFAELTKIS